MRKNWKGLTAIFFIVFLDMLSLGIVIPVLTIIFFDKGSTLLPSSYSYSKISIIYGFLNATFPLAQFFGAPILGALSDRFGRKITLISSLIGTLVGHLLFGIGVFIGNIPLLFLSRLIDGFTAGNISIATSAVADISAQKNKSKNFGLIAIAYALGIILGPFFGGRLSDRKLIPWFSNSTPFWIAAGFSFLATILVYFGFKETLTSKIHTPISMFTSCRLIKQAFKIPNLRIIFLVTTLITLGFSFLTFSLPVFLFEKFKYTEMQTGTFLAYSGLWIVLGLGIVNTFALKKYHPQKILILAIAVLCVALFALMFPNNAYHLYIIIPFIGIAYSLTQPNSLSIISNLSSEETQGEVLGTHQALQALATTIPPIITGFIIAKDINAPLLLASLSVCFAGMIYMRLFNKKINYKNTEKFREIK